MPRRGWSQHSGWRCSTEHHLSWSTESSGVNPAPHPGARKHAGKRSDSLPNIAVPPRGHSKARTETPTALCTIRYLRDRNPARFPLVVCACLPRYVAQGALNSTGLRHAIPFTSDTRSSSGQRRGADAASSSRNNLLNNHARYRLQYLTRYLISRCSYSLDRYQAARLLPHLAARLCGDPRRRHSTHFGYWQQTTWWHTHAEVVGAVPRKLARKIILAIGVSPYCEPSRIAQARALLSTRRPVDTRALLSTRSPVDASPHTTVAVAIPPKVRASGRNYVAERPPVCVSRAVPSRSLPAGYAHAVCSDIHEVRAHTYSKIAFRVSPTPQVHGDAQMPPAAVTPAHTQASQ
jgi:hypothetical protein